MGEPGIEGYWVEGDRFVAWAWQGDEVETGPFARPPRAVVFWQEPPSVLVIEAFPPGTRQDNAVVFNPDGTERVRLTPPAESLPQWNIGFYTAYRDAGGLVVVFSTRGGDVWGRPDLLTGEFEVVAEWR